MCVLPRFTANLRMMNSFMEELKQLIKNKN